MKVPGLKEIGNRNTIFGKMVFFFSLILSVSLLLLGFAISNVTKEEVKNQYIESFKANINSDKKYVDYVIGTVDSLSVQILQDRELVKAITTKPKNDLEKVELERAVTKALVKIRISNDRINSMYVINPYQNSAGDPAIFTFKEKIQNLVSNAYYKKALELNGESLWMPPHANILSQNGDMVISNVRLIKDIYTNEAGGVLFINIKPENIIEYAEKEKKNSVEKMILNNEKIVMGHTDSHMIGKNLSGNAEVKEIFAKISNDLKKGGENAQISGSVIYNSSGKKMFGYYSYSNQSKLIYMNVIPYKMLTQTANKLSVIIFGISLAILILTVLATVMFSFSISEPIKTLTHHCHEMSKGNFTNGISEKLLRRKDEIGQLAAGFRKIGDSVNGVLVEIKEENKEILRISEELNSGNANLTDRVSEEATNIMDIASTMNEISHAMQSNLGKVNNLSEFIQNTAENVKNTQVDSAVLKKAFYDIKESSGMIKEMLEIIEEVAFQTNLLALNAAVEAARAGDSGRGFAVVALEIRTLSYKTNNFLKDIKNLMNDDERKNLNGEMVINKTLENMDDVTKEIMNITELILEINQNVQEQSEGVEQINQSLASLEEITQSNSSMSEEIAAISNVLKEGVLKLLNRILFFKLDESKK